MRKGKEREKEEGRKKKKLAAGERIQKRIAKRKRINPFFL